MVVVLLLQYGRICAQGCVSSSGEMWSLHAAHIWLEYLQYFHSNSSFRGSFFLNYKSYRWDLKFYLTQNFSSFSRYTCLLIGPRGILGDAKPLQHNAFRSTCFLSHENLKKPEVNECFLFFQMQHFEPWSLFLIALLNINAFSNLIHAANC